MASSDNRPEATATTTEDESNIRECGVGDVDESRRACAALVCPDCGELLACSVCRPHTISTRECRSGCGTFRFHHRRRVVRRSASLVSDRRTLVTKQR